MGQMRWLALASFALLTLSSQLAFAICGDGNREVAEACDDGNLVSGDGCSSTCQIEDQFVCESSNFSLQTAEALPGGTQPGWDLAADNLGVTQNQNSAAGVYTTNMPADMGEITFTLRVGATNDDDFIGWTVGYDTGELAPTGAAGDRDFLYFNWKQLAQVSGGVPRPAGLWLTRLTGPATDSQLWTSTGNATKVAEAVSGLGTTGWVDNTAYRVRMRYTTSSIQVWVTPSSNTSLNGSFGGQPEVLAFDLTGSFPAGNFGFWTHSQEQCQFRLVGLNGAAPGSDICSVDTDGDGVKDRSDGDADGDGIPDSVEAPGFAGNPNADTDGDGIPDWNDPDHIPGGCTPTGSPARCASLPLVYDRDQDGIPNHLDLDSDGDGLPDSYEAGLIDLNLNGSPDLCVAVDAFGLCLMGGVVGPAPDSDGDGQADYLDVDSDDDGILDAVEAFDTTGDLIANVVASGFDTLGNGIDDTFDPRCTAALCDGRVGVTSTLPDSDGDGVPNHLQTCGDGYKIVAEACDDGNTTTGDGCSDVCAVETGYVCDGTPRSVCETVCGDGVVAGAETCDDDNLVSGDGCSAMCAVEDDYTCPVAGGDCLTVDLLTPASMARLDANTVTYSGTATAGAQVTVIVRDSLGAELETFTATANGSGAWTASRPLADGAYSASASVTTTGGTFTDAPNAFLVDATAPAVALTAPANNAIANDATPTISGTATDAGGLAMMSPVTVTVLDAQGGVAFTATPAVGNDGLWSVDTSALTDGVYTVTATALDAAGNTTTTTARTFTIDTIAPALSILAPANGAEINDSAPTISGTAEAGASVIVTIDGAPQPPVIAAADGTWSITSPTLDGGPHTVSVVATDAAGNASTAATTTFTVDIAAPAVALVAPLDGATLDDSTPTISGTAEAGASVVVTIDDEPQPPVIAAADGTWSITSPTLDDGSHTVSVIATDAVGNASAPVSASFTVDLTAPAVALTAPADDAVLNDATPTLSGTASDAGGLAAGTPVTVTVLTAQGLVAFTADVAVDGAGAWSVDADMLNDGIYTITATATDAAGNTTTTTARSFLIDTVAPIVTIIAPADDATLANPRPTLTGTTEPGSSVIVTVLDAQGATVFEETVTADAASGAWQLPLVADLPDGSYTISAVATDVAGNEGVAATSGFAIDSTALELSILEPTAGASLSQSQPPLSGTTAPDAEVTVTLRDDQGAVVETLSVTADATGAWSVTPTMALADGAYEATATVTNTAGIVTTEVVGFIIDTIAPSLALLTPLEDASLNDPAPAITGTSEPGAQIEVELRDAQGDILETLTAIAGPLGQWSVAPSMPLTDGAYSVVAVALDDAGNSTTQGPRAFTIDTIAPALTITAPAADELFIVRDVVVTGVTDPDQEVVLTLHDAQGDVVSTQTVTADAQGDWSVSFENLQNGAYTVSASAVDAATNASDAEVDFVVDSQQPELILTSPAQDLLTNAPNLVIAGQASADAEVVIIIRDSAGVELDRLTPTLDDSAMMPLASFDITSPMPLPDGAYTVEVIVTRPNGLSTQETRAVIIDTMAPTVTISQPGAGAIVGVNNPMISGMSDPGATVVVRMDGQEVGTVTADAAGVWTLALSTPLADGAHAVSVTATDAAGNVGEPVTRDFTVDTSAPMVMLTAPVQGQTLAPGVVVVSGIAAPGATVSIVIDGEVVGMATADASGMWSFQAPALAEGDHTVEARVTNEAGTTGTSGELTFEVREPMMSAPVTITSPGPGATVSGPGVTVSGAGTPGAMVTVTVGDQSQTVTVGEDGMWSVTFDEVAQGRTTIRASDGRTSVTLTVTVGQLQSPYSDAYLVGGGCAQGSGQAPAGAGLWLLGLGLLYRARRKRRA